MAVKWYLIVNLFSIFMISTLGTAHECWPWFFATIYSTYSPVLNKQKNKKTGWLFVLLYIVCSYWNRKEGGRTQPLKEWHSPRTQNKLVWTKELQDGRQVCVSRSVMSNSLRPHRLHSTRLLCPWESPRKNTGVGCHSLLQGIFLTQGSHPRLLHWRQILYHWARREESNGIQQV